MDFLLRKFRQPEYSNFTFSSGDPADNPLHQYASEIFEQPELLHEISKKLVQYLYNNSMHPSIKGGEFIMCHFEDLLIDDEMVSGIGIFKSETRDVFLRLLEQNQDYMVSSQVARSIGALDKACLILNTEKSKGYKICTFDTGAKKEARFWTENFLNLKPREDDYQFTSHYIQLTKDFVEDKRKSGEDFTKEEELTVMNASKSFFESNSNFDESEYLEEVFETGLAEDFTRYKRSAQSTTDFALEPEFDISQEAVKRKSGVWKSVIKLDKNFSLYVHGDRNMIEKGEDEHGRKYYKLYYEEEK